jgi:diadenosine tetraphosphate (Ap4A) HIT family hydrolase
MTRTSKRVDLPPEVDGECVFCRILDGRSPASLVAADEHAVAFMDLQPAVPGHLLVIPRAHASGLAELDDADGAAVWALGARIARRLRAAGLAEGVNFLLADGVAAGQEVWHVHLHVLPRHRGDGMGFTADWQTPERAELDAAAARVRAALEA